MAKKQLLIILLGIFIIAAIYANSARKELEENEKNTTIQNTTIKPPIKVELTENDIESNKLKFIIQISRPLNIINQKRNYSANTTDIEFKTYQKVMYIYEVKELFKNEKDFNISIIDDILIIESNKIDDDIANRLNSLEKPCKQLTLTGLRLINKSTNKTWKIY